ncbi:MAG: TonB-dependent receptor, partial [Muribaculaceae bacterium]|nr:TonB-dependent receptor [Muribaculaceae bacterium]
MPAPYRLADGSLSWPERYGAYPQLSAQVTRNFRHFSVYVGGENLTGFRQKNPIIGANDPWGRDFDATMVYGPLHGAMFYIGFRYNFTKYI